MRDELRGRDGGREKDRIIEDGRTTREGTEGRG